MTIKHKEYSDLNDYKKKCCSYKKLELLFNINKALFLSFRVVIIIIIITVTVFHHDHHHCHCFHHPFVKEIINLLSATSSCPKSTFQNPFSTFLTCCSSFIQFCFVTFSMASSIRLFTSDILKVTIFRPQILSGPI